MYTRQTIYRVSIGVRDVCNRRFEHDNEFFFTNPPTKEEFLATRPPWMEVWKDTILPAIQSNPFPYLQLGTKRSEVEFPVNEQIVRVLVEKVDVIGVPYRDQIIIPHDDIKSALGRKYKDDDKAYVFLLQNENLVIDRYQKQNSTFVAIMKKLLIERAKSLPVA